MSRHILLATAAGVLALAVAACGSSQKPRLTTHPFAGVTQKAATTSTPASSTTTGGLSGKWTGQYSGAYSGTFALNWQQSGPSLGGKITLSAPASTLGINGSVTGSAIKFGTVGGGVIYSGSVRGSSMSGSYETPKGGGSWSASKS